MNGVGEIPLNGNGVAVAHVSTVKKQSKLYGNAKRLLVCEID